MLKNKLINGIVVVARLTSLTSLISPTSTMCLASILVPFVSAGP